MSAEQSTDSAATAVLIGKPYDWSRYCEITYAAWLIGRRLAGKQPQRQSVTRQDGAAARVSLHPANWR
jgi:hypothetical protein